jgi:lysozyme family protein
MKNRALNLTNNHYAPENYWDYAYECVTELINNKAVRHLNCRTLYESLRGETPDISIVHYYFYESIHHMEPIIKFPQHIHTMLPRKVLC